MSPYTETDPIFAISTQLATPSRQNALNSIYIKNSNRKLTRSLRESSLSVNTKPDEIIFEKRFDFAKNFYSLYKSLVADSAATAQNTDISDTI